MAKIKFDEKTGTIIVRGIQVTPGHSDLKYKHFAGDASPTNEAGNQNFSIKISEEDAAELTAALAKNGKSINIKHDKYDTHFKVNIRRPVDIAKFNKDKSKAVILKTNNIDEMRALDHAMIGEGEICCLPYLAGKFNQWTCYLDSMWFVPIVNPVQAFIDSARVDTEIPTIALEDDEVPFE